MAVRSVRGFHGTTRASADDLLKSGGVPKPSIKPGNWLGRGFYFFEENVEMAALWAIEQVNVRARMGFYTSSTVLQADLDLADCLDLCTTKWHGPLKASAENLQRAGQLPQQFGPEFESADGKLTKVEDYSVVPKPGFDPLDHFADSAAINALVEDLIASGHPVSCVRAAFTAGPQTFPNSHLFRDTHIQIAVLDPPRVINNLRIITPP
jgi:hypothetical protein